jgi:Flp pilus assembly pilin Flp
MKNHRIVELLRDTRGANMVEYIILVGVVALLAIAAFTTFSGKVSTEIGNQGDTVSGINNSAGTPAH